MALRSGQGHPDHVIQFAAGATLQNSSTLAIALASAPSSLLACASDSSPLVAPAACAANDPGPPPDAIELLLRLRSIVLII
jgi:hypothetical protein